MTRLQSLPVAVLVASLVPAPPARAEQEAGPRWTVDDCVRRALQGSARIAEAEAKVAEWRGRLSEVRATLHPKLQGMGFVAPMFRVRGSPLDADVQRDYADWGPYLHFEATLAQPLYTFGRAAAGTRAAAERAEVERANALLTRNAVAAETRRYYYLHLFARSMRPSLASGRKALDEAQRVAQREYDEASGRVTNVDLMKLAYASSELAKYEIQAELGEGLALAALKHVMGLGDSDPLALADETLPPLPEEPLPPLAELLVRASRQRPEWLQIRHGREAALSLAQAERLANAPVVFAAGQLGADYTPMRPDVANPFAFDQYNNLSGGVAVGLQFDLDLKKAAAKTEQALAMQGQVEALARFAETGIPLDVRRARDEAEQAERIAREAAKGAAAARKWLLFAAAAMASGTGEAKDVLEGLAAYLQGRNSEYGALRDAHIARAQLEQAIGSAGVDGGR